MLVGQITEPLQALRAVSLASEHRAHHSDSDVVGAILETEADTRAPYPLVTAKRIYLCLLPKLSPECRLGHLARSLASARTSNASVTLSPNTFMFVAP